LRASGFPGIPGWFTEEQQRAWALIVQEIHAKAAVFFAQLWHQGRVTHSAVIGQTPESSSNVPYEGQVRWNRLANLTFQPPKAMTKREIERTQQDFVKAAENAIAAGCDGIEIHAGNGYLFDQFHHSNSQSCITKAR